jgi:site-specific recombinase
MMDEFEFLDSCAGNWERLPPERRTRNQQAVVDVVGTVAAVQGDGFAGWWENIIRFGDLKRDFDRVVESFQLAGLGSFAEVILGTLSPWSACWFFAMFTGVLLWLSSLFAAWVDNWFVLHQLGPALGSHRGWRRWFGPTRTRRMALWLEHNIAGLAGNISLGLMLGIIPVVAIFFGLPLDVRHVTLSTGQVTAAFAALGGEHFLRLSTVWIAVGILGTGLLNLGVSFALALWVAIRARNVRGPELHFFYRALLKRLLQSPLSFVLPVGTVHSTNPTAP